MPKDAQTTITADTIIDVGDFVSTHQKEFPELDNFLGFAEEEEDDLGEERKMEDSDRDLIES